EDEPGARLWPDRTAVAQGRRRRPTLTRRSRPTQRRTGCWEGTATEGGAGHAVSDAAGCARDLIVGAAGAFRARSGVRITLRLRLAAGRPRGRGSFRPEQVADLDDHQLGSFIHCAPGRVSVAA